MRRIVAAFALALLMAAPMVARAQGPSVNVWSINHQNPVEQQTPGGMLQPDESLWVVNPTIGTPDVHVWDADDQINLMFSGVFEPGQELVYSTGLIGDWAPHLIGLKLMAERGPVLLRASVEIEGVVRLETSRATVIVGPDYDRADAPLVAIPGSNGGVGIVHRITWKVWNPTDRRVRGQGANAAIKLNFDGAADLFGAPFPLSVYGQRGGTYPGPTWYWWTG